MSEETITPEVDTTLAETETAPVVESQDSTAERTFTQSEVNALMAKEASKLKRRIKKQNGSQRVEPQPPPDNPGEEKVTRTLDALEKIMGRLEQLESDNEEKSREAKFNSIVKGREIDSDVRSLLFTSFDAEHPEQTVQMLDKISSFTTHGASTYQSPGAPSQSQETVRGPNPMGWSKDDVQVLRQEGRFIDALEKWRSTLPGGGGNLFANRNNKKKTRS